MLYRFLRSNKGFTLTEIMIVVVILGILTAVALPLFHGVLNIQKKKDCKCNREIIEGTIKQAMLGKMDNGNPQRNLADELYINMDPSRTSHVTTVNYNDENVNCFKVVPVGVGEDDLVFTLGDVRCGYYTYEQAVNDINYINSLDDDLFNLSDDYSYGWAKYVKKLDIDAKNKTWKEIKNNDENKKLKKNLDDSLRFCKYEMGCTKTKKGQTINKEGKVVAKAENVGYYLKREELKDVPMFIYLCNMELYFSEEECNKYKNLLTFTCEHFQGEECPKCPVSDDYTYYVLSDGTCICSECQ
ncbi:MAG: type II secretion system protein [Acutalibacteraceae bacterium]